MVPTPDRINRIDLLHEDLKLSRDDLVAEGNVQLTIVTDGRIHGASRMFLNDERTDIVALSIEPTVPRRWTAANEWVGQWLVSDGCYGGVAGTYNQVQFWVQEGVVIGIYGVWKEDYQRTFRYMRRRLEQGDLNVVANDEERRLIQEQDARSANLPRLRVPGDPPPQR